jgi:hypothetical protein
MSPSIAAGTSLGGCTVAAGHFKTRIGTLPVAAEELVPSFLYDTTQLLGEADPGLAAVQAGELPALAVTVTAPPEVK